MLLITSGLFVELISVIANDMLSDTIDAAMLMDFDITSPIFESGFITL